MLKIAAFFLCTVIFAHASEAPPEKKICLNMIVKDESPVICRCLASVKPWIDYWVIVDTGSKDGTQQVIREFMKDIPGELHERPWVNFGHNRNEAMSLAKGKGDYLLFIDADEEFIFSKEFSKSELKGDGYLIAGQAFDDELNKPVTFYRLLLVNNYKDWSWQGVIHETLVRPPDAKPSEKLDGITFLALAKDGHRSQDPRKYYKDAEVLEKALLEEPNNSRYVFYLGSTYENAKEYALALKNYEKRANMNGWDQETFYAQYSAGKMKQLLKMDSGSIISSFSKAFQMRPSRAEPLYHLAHLYVKEKNYTLGYALAKAGIDIPISKDHMPIDEWIYQYGLLFELATCAYELGKYEEAALAYEKVLAHPELPKEQRDMAKLNLLSIKLKGK